MNNTKLETEKALIGAILCGGVENVQAYDLLGDVSPELWNQSPFADPRCAAVYAGVRSLDRKNLAVDSFTVAEELRVLGLDKVVKLEEILAIHADGGVPSMIPDYAKIVCEHHINRALVRIGQELQARVHEAEKDSSAIIETLEQQLFALRGVKNSKGASLSTVVPRVIAEASQPQVKLRGSTTGIATLDKVLGGFRDTQFAVLAARTSECKSTAAISFALACARSGKSVLFFSMEMSEEEIVAKCLSNIAQIDSNAIEQGMVTGLELPSLRQAGDALMKLPLTLYCEGAVSPSEIKSKVRYHAAKGKIGLVVADYIQLMNGGKQGTREREISTITNSLKAMAMTLRIPVLGLAQLSRETVRRGGPPQLQDLRESGAIEQDANKVIFNYFPDRETRQDSKYDDVENMQFIVAKNRGSKLATVNAIVDKRFTLFTEPEISAPAW